MILISNDGREVHKIVDGSAVCDSAVCAPEHGGVSFSWLIAERGFSTATPSSPGAFTSFASARLSGTGYIDIILTGGFVNFKFPEQPGTDTIIGGLGNDGIWESVGAIPGAEDEQETSSKFMYEYSDAPNTTDTPYTMAGGDEFYVS